MATVSIKFGGSAAVIAAMQSRTQALRDKVDEAVQGAGIDCQARAKQNCPVDTGRLRASIQYQPYILSCQVGTDVNYCWYVELGTHKMAARPYLYPAYVKASRGLLDEIKGLVI